MQDQVVYISHNLDLSSMVCLLFKVPQSKDSSYSPFTQITLRCRQLIFEFAGHVLASPVTDSSTIQVMCLTSLLTNNAFSSKLEKLQLSQCGKIPFSTSMVEEAMSYTLMARLAPAWNKVGDWLLGGRQFLHQADRIPAVQVKVHMADTRMELSITATTVVFPLLQPDDLGLDYNTMMQFIEGDRDSSLNVEHFGVQSVLVLPKLTRGKLVSVTKQLPPNSKFSQWSAMKRYWKNMYGYRLEVEDGMEPVVYYNVSFWAGSVLTYPEWTVRRSSPRPVPRSDPRPVVELFIKELQEHNKMVCGNIFKLDEKPVVPLVEAVRVSQFKVDEGNICARVGWVEPKLPYRVEEVKKSQSHQSLWNKCGGRGDDDSGYVTDISQNEVKMVRTHETNNYSISHTGQDKESKEAHVQPGFDAPRFVTSQEESKKTSEYNTTKGDRIVPSFSSRRSSKPANSSANQTAKSVTPLSFPTFNPVKHPTHTSPPPSNATAPNKPNLQSLMNSLPIKTTFLSRLVSNGGLNCGGDSNQNRPSLPISGLAMSRPVSSTPSFLSRPTPVRPPLTSPKTKKLKATVNDESFSAPTTPVPRKKPSIQSVDITQLVKEKGMLAMAKVNTATLLDYCRKEGIKAAKAKCKKDELVRLVMIHNNIPFSVVSALENEK